MKFCLVPVLCALVFFSCNDNGPDPVSREQWKVFSWLPGDTEYLLYVNPGELTKTDHWKQIPSASIPGSEGSSWLYDFEKQTGISLNKGIGEIYTAVTWEANNVVAVSFTSGQDKIRRYFENTRSFLSEKIHGKKVYFTAEAPDTRYYFPDESHLLIIKNVEYLSKIIKGENASLKGNKKFLGIIDNIRSKKYYWFATDKGTYAAVLIQKLTGINRDLKSNNIISSIDNISLAADFSDDILIESVIGCKDEKNALLLSTGIRSAVAMDLFSTKSSYLGELLKNLEVKRENKILNLELTLSEKDITELKKRQTGNNL